MVFSFKPLFAQHIDRNVYSCSGAYALNPNLEINYNIGEPVVFTGKGTGIIASQGFEQPNENIVTAVDLYNPIMAIKAFPNPVSGVLYLSFNNNLIIPDLEIETIDLFGQKIAAVLPHSYLSSDAIYTLDFSTAGNGIYFIKVSSKKFDFSNVLKIIKNK